jgi:hypothetical protein
MKKVASIGSRAAKTVTNLTGTPEKNGLFQ